MGADELMDAQDQGQGFGMEAARAQMAAIQAGAPSSAIEGNAVVSMLSSADMTSAQQMTMMPGDLNIGHDGALELHFDDSEDLLVSIIRGIDLMERSRERAGLPPATPGPGGDGGGTRVLLYSPHLEGVDMDAAGRGGRKPAGYLQLKANRFIRRMEDGLKMLDSSGLAPETMRIFLGSEWFVNEAGEAMSVAEQAQLIGLMSGGMSGDMNWMLVPGTLKWSATPMVAGAAADEPADA